MSGLLFATAVGLLIPLGFFAWSVVKRQWLPFTLGVLAFTISQVLIRLPLLSYLSQNNTDFMMWGILHPLQYAVFLGLTAAIAEELARYFAMRFFMKQQQWSAGLFFGAGHGGVEALLLLGLPVVTMLTASAPLMAGGSLYFLGGLERMMAMLLHIGLSILVLQAVRHRRLSFLLWAVGLHAAVDAMIGIVPMFVPSEWQLVAIEGFLGMVAVSLFIYCIGLRRKDGWK